MAGEIGVAIRAKDDSSAGFGAAAKSVISFNQALGLARKALRLFNVASDATVGAALKLRSKFDPMKQQLEAFDKTTTKLGASIGNVFVPVLAAMAQAFGPIIAGITKWVESNRKLISVGLIKFLGAVADVMVSGVAMAIVQVTRGFSGLQIIFEALKLGFTGFIELTTAGLAKVIGALETVARATGADTLADKLGSAGEAVRGLSDSFAQTRIEAGNAITQIANDQIALEQQVGATAEATRASIAKAIESAGKAAANDRAVQISLAEAQAATFLKLEERIAAGKDAIRASNAQRLADLHEAEIEAEMARAEFIKGIQSDLFEGISGGFSSMIENMVSGNMTASESFRAFAKNAADSVVTAVEKIVTARAAEAAAGAAASKAAIPIVGPALAAAAMAAMFALVRGLLGKLIKGADGGEVRRFARGGEVTGGIAGRDSVHGLLMPGERVLTVRENHALKTLATGLTRGRILSGGFRAQAGGEAVAGAAPGANITITASVNNPEEMTDSQVKRWLMRIGKQAEDLHRDGLFLRTARAT